MISPARIVNITKKQEEIAATVTLPPHPLTDLEKEIEKRRKEKAETTEGQKPEEEKTPSG